jgi:hypothetical protein
MRNRSFLRPVVSAAAFLFLCCVAAVALPPRNAITGVIKTSRITLANDSTLPNGNLLKAGDYTVKVNNSQVEFLQYGKVKGETSATLVPENHRINSTQVLLSQNQITELDLKGMHDKVMLSTAGTAPTAMPMGSNSGQ